MGATSIEWTDVAWPVLNGCRRISPGCLHCYAEKLTASRLRNHPKYKGLAVYTENGPRWTGESRLWTKDLTMPLRLRAPSNIFVCDMGDLFFEGNSDEEIDSIFGVMWACLYLGKHGIAGHTFQVLTKRAQRMREYLSTDRRKLWAQRAVHYGGEYDPDGIYDQTMERSKEPHPRIVLMVSAENQETAEERIPELLATPAALRGVSAEPLLGPLDLSRFMWPVHSHWPAGYSSPEAAIASGATVTRHRQALVSAHARFLDWVIVGGESGPKARPYPLDAARDIIRQCREAHVTVFHKQVGALVETGEAEALGKSEWGPYVRFHEDADLLKTKHPKGADPSEWPEDLRVREFPKVSQA